ncbi:MAG: DUF808 domain-containing protein [Sphingomonadales bacterium]|nr:DUF808 domain-containing protein [Sphingomonadales bacterium]MBD3773446.1 DUF808 domain-containing protein [Paracoccaceae bacterium]
MPGGLVALLDDISVIARSAAASIDDVGVAAGKAGSKAAGVVIDDAAVTPSYVTSLPPARELPIIGKITLGSLRNKLLILLPIALLLSQFLPGAIIPLLMLGGAYLSFEGAEKVMEWLGGEKHGQTLEEDIADPAAFEKQRVAGAVRTDLILSAEIMAIALSQVADESLFVRAGVLAVVGVLLTFVVYGAVGLIVKLDDIGLHLANRKLAATRKLGCAMVKAMPIVLVVLSFVGTLAMLWVGGGIILHGLEELGLHAPAELAHGLQESVAAATGPLGGVLGWLTYAVASAIVGLVLGAVLAMLIHQAQKLAKR